MEIYFSDFEIGEKRLKMSVSKIASMQPVITHATRSIAIIQELSVFSWIMTMTRAASIESNAYVSFKKNPRSIADTTPTQMKNKLGVCIRNSSKPMDEPKIFAFILSNANLFESSRSGERTNNTEIMLQ